MKGSWIMIAVLRFIAVVVFGLAIWTLPAPQVLAEDISLADAESLPPSIHQVAAGGYWSRDKKEGFFRAIVTAGGTEHVSHRLYLQWLEIDPDTQSYNVASTRGVKEINDGHGSLLDVKAEFPDLEFMKLSVDARSDRPPQESRFTITVKGDETYVVKRN